MIHDPDLLDQLAKLPVEPFVGEVCRATRISLDPLAFSTSGGRWSPPGEIGVLYTSLNEDGAIAEIAFHWSQLTPPPSKSVVLYRLKVSTNQTLRLIRTNLTDLGIDMNSYSELDYQRTQQIGAAVSFLGNDGLIVPSARWQCENLILFSDNSSLHTTLEVETSEHRDWQAWCRKHDR